MMLVIGDLFDAAGSATLAGGGVDMGRVMTFFYRLICIGAGMAVTTCVFFIMGGIAAVRIACSTPNIGSLGLGLGLGLGLPFCLLGPTHGADPGMCFLPEAMWRFMCGRHVRRRSGRRKSLNQSSVRTSPGSILQARRGSLPRWQSRLS